MMQGETSWNNQAGGFLFAEIRDLLGRSSRDGEAGQVVWDTLPSDGTYQCCSGFAVTGSSFNLDLDQPVLIAAAFEPNGNYELSEIDVAFAYSGEIGTNSFSLSLDSDANALPGAVIESWTGLSAPGESPGPSSLLESVSPVTAVILSGGSQYWIVASPAASNTDISWSLISGGQALIASNNGFGGWFPDTISGGALALDIQGAAIEETEDAPESNPAALLVSGLLLMVALCRLRDTAPVSLSGVDAR
jgi:hypothetical protein